MRKRKGAIDEENGGDEVENEAEEEQGRGEVEGGKRGRGEGQDR